MGHINYSLDICVGTFIVYQGKVLLLWHRKCQSWLCPGGHVEIGEEPPKAAIREAKEETGLDLFLLGEIEYFVDERVTRYQRPMAIDTHPITDTHSHFCLYWAAVSVHAPPDPLVSPEGSILSWVDPELPPSPIWPNCLHYCKRALQIATLSGYRNA